MEENEEVTKVIVVNDGWSPRTVFLNTLGTIIGAATGFLSLIISIIALIIAMKS